MRLYAPDAPLFTCQLRAASIEHAIERFEADPEGDSDWLPERIAPVRRGVPRWRWRWTRL